MGPEIEILAMARKSTIERGIDPEKLDSQNEVPLMACWCFAWRSA